MTDENFEDMFEIFTVNIKNEEIPVEELKSMILPCAKTLYHSISPGLVPIEERFVCKSGLRLLDLMVSMSLCWKYIAGHDWMCDGDAYLIRIFNKYTDNRHGITLKEFRNAELVLLDQIEWRMDRYCIL
jgi:hypothetical protein